MENIFLTGFMGTGKTTVSEELCRRSGMRGLDMDKAIEEQEGRTISGIFKQDGEACFRKLETDWLRNMKDRKDCIISCGGGTPLRAENVREMRKNGVIVLLTAEAETIYERVKDSHDRPLLEQDKSVEFIKGLLEQREEKYAAAADIVVRTDGKTAVEIAEEIWESIGKRTGKE